MSIEHVLYDHNVKNGGSVRSVNGKHGNVTITAAEIGAAPAVHKHEISDVTGLQSSLEVLDTTKELLTDMNRKSVTLAEGTHIVTSETSALVDVEIEGRTLTSMANSNLEGGKYYVVADPKTKVGVDKKVFVGGVGKFQKAQTLNTVADFANKESGSLIGNPHILRYRDGLTSLIIPTDISNINEHTNNGYQMIARQDSSTLTRIGAVVGGYAQSLFSFNVVEQIERELGLIPSDTLAGKIQWAKDNIGSLIGNWHGYGQGPAGFKASFTVWSTTGVWVTPAASHVNFTGAVAKVARDETANLINRIDSDGYVHFLAYAVPSDGTTSAIINTDFVNLEISLKPTVQLNTRGKIIRVENFDGKISGSTVENPHISKRSLHSVSNGNPELLLPNGSWTAEFGENHLYGGYQRSYKLDGDVSTTSTTFSTGRSQHLFSFNIIEAVERNVGKIPASSVSEKVAWIKEKIERIDFRWSGFGSSSVGPNARVRAYSAFSSEWAGSDTTSRYHTNTQVQLLGFSTGYWGHPAGVRNIIGSDGFAHYISYAESSDGITPSSISTDYAELEIELKPTADFHAPKVPLYEVTKPEYDKIGIAWDENEVRRRYPAVEGTQHLVNPYVMAEGDNLIPSFYEAESVNAAFTISGPYEASLKATAQYQSLKFTIPVFSNMPYTFSWNQSLAQYAYAYELDENKNDLSKGLVLFTTNSSTELGFVSKTVITKPNTKFITLHFQNDHRVQDIVFKNPMLTLGSTAKPFVSRNPSYLYAEAKLGSLGNKKDVLFKEDGKWKVRRFIEKNVELDGSLSWQYNLDFAGTKRFVSSSTSAKAPTTTLEVVGVKSDGSALTPGTTSFGVENFVQIASGGVLHINVSDRETGFAETFVPTLSDTKRYFNGWKYSNGTTWTSVTGNGQTATAQVALDTKPTDYTPYKISYVLASPVVEEVNVEGEIKVDGVTQMEVSSGAIISEKITPFENASVGTYHINRTAFPTSLLKNPVDRLINVYKNGRVDISWYPISDQAYGKFRLESKVFDKTAEYKISYMSLQKQTLTNAPTNTKLTYANSIRASFQDLVTDVEDVSTQVSVDSKFLLDLMVQLKAMRG